MPISAETPLPSPPATAARPIAGSRGRAYLRRVVLAALGIGALASSGCMHRRLTIRSDPPGAAVLVDGEELGFTPVSLDYTYYGTREITLVKDGYKTVTAYQKVATPWYQVFPLEFFTDNLAMTHIRDKRDVLYTLEPEVLMPTGEVLDRANSLRSNALRSDMPYPGQP